MTIPTRPAPPPPISRSLSQASNSNGHLSSNSPVNNSVNKKKAPPRPPPPKMQESVKQPNQPATINRIANFFASSKKSISKSSEKISHVPSQVLRAPPQLPAPLISSQSHAIAEASYTVLNNDVKLINLDTSPPSSPTLIKKTNTGSDSVSMDSFCSSNSSSKNLGTASQAESGFEDDFSVSDFKVTSGMTSRSTTFSTDPFDLLDDFSPSSQAASAFTNQPSNIRNVIPSTLQQKNVSTGNVSYSVPYNTISVPNSSSAFDETLCNGKNLIKQQPISMPTIIKPAGRVAKNPLIYGTKKVSPSPLVYSNNNLLIDESFDDDEDLPSPPMPKIPPPPPPLLDEPEDDEKESHGFALYDYESDVTEDLNFKANEKIYLIKQMNDEWMYGRNKRGCEGIFPVSFINIRVPLKLEPDSGTASRSQSVSPSEKGTLIRALYTFNAETDEDLTIKENEMINVIYGITSEWLYGSNSFGAFGQFPSSFIEYVPENLPQMPK